ncbi:translation machinery-associated protein 16 [Pogonomyrmex barbatus]|uniref:Translation machinery-associated protein 16 n=1 Tax=Pogonomyrmex barbatus TaxID=144034 RepID=A0A6I9X285_9HYME|nr:translation machinery-associated protein 16 [Pogonomyrmex barbatus]
MSGKIRKEKKELMKAKKILHPNSRKVNAIVKRTHKAISRQKSKWSSMIKQQLIGEKLMWLKQNMCPDLCPYMETDIVKLLVKYIGRNDEELEQIEIKHSIGKRGRQHANRQDIILMSKKEEQTQLDTCGIGNIYYCY